MSTPVSHDHELLTRAEAGAYLGIRPQTLSLWASVGRYDLPYIRVGRCVRYRRSDLDAFLARRTITHVEALEAQR